MPTQITKTVYTFKELIAAADDPESNVSSRAVEKVRDKLQQWATDGDWYDYVYEVWKDALNQIGFREPELRFTGFASQGDGASFTCKGLDIEKLLWFLTHKIKGKNCIEPTKRTITTENPTAEDFLPYVVHRIPDYGYNTEFRKLKRYVDAISGSVDDVPRSGNYCHEGTACVQIEGTTDLPASKDQLFDDFIGVVEDLRRALSKAIYKELNDEYDYKTTDEYLIEEDEANERHWDESGNYEKA